MLSFAIVIPNLNQSHFLRTALESLRHQSVPFEVALMDGGSTDDLHSVIEPYSDIITFFRSRPDSGQADAIREGKNALSGDVVAWLNADDYYFAGALNRVAAAFEQDPELDVVYGDAVHVTPEGFFLSYFPRIQEFNRKDLTCSCFICQPSCFVRRSAYEALGGIDSSLRYTMDWDLWCRLSEHGARFCYLHEV
ncbi:MAG: glycosyltransferase family 2 protein, partial [Planctomycetota bacterium]